MNPGGEDPAGVAFAGEIVSRAIPLFWLTDLQRLGNHGFLVVSTAAMAVREWIEWLYARY